VWSVCKGGQRQFEGFGNVIIEAMACGIPVVSTDCPSVPADIVQHGVNGYLVKVGDWKALADTMVTLLQDEKERKRIAASGKKSALDFSVKAMVLKYERIFKIYDKK
jgi:GalNAc-alpha-(1->4)-GalNAc-alpha-(1->3)-diNAcBac-PP-undecaprenol alpha-1,4-N-acetyl-D-galactosaminyltransferase